MTNPHHETADEYGRTLGASGRWRVVRCKDDVQFIVQKRRGGARARPWQAEAYILDPKALSPVLHRRSLGIPPEDVAAIMAELHQARVTEAT